MLISRNSEGRTREYYEMLKRAGWQAVDINETCDPRRFLASHDEQVEFVKGVIKLITDAGLEIGQCHAPMAECYGDKSDEAIAERFTAVENCVRVAGELGIPATIVHPVIYSWSGDESPERTLEMNVKHLKRLCEVCGDTKVCLENMPGCNGFIRNAEEMKKMSELVGEKLYFCIDTGHAFSNKLKISSFFEVLGDKIAALHIHDSCNGADMHLLPYSTNSDWADFKAAIKQYNYQGTLNSESNFSVRLPESMRFEAEQFEASVIRSLMD